MSLVAWYFVLSGVISLAAVLYHLVGLLDDARGPGGAGATPVRALVLSTLAALAWLLTGRDLLKRRRRGAIFALGTFLVVAVGWFAGTTPTLWAILPVGIGTVLILSTWLELRG